MSEGGGHRVSRALIRAALLAVLAVPVAAAAFSPQLAWRDPVYIAAGFAGVIAMSLLLLQPVLAGGYLLGLSTAVRRRFHRVVGVILVIAVVVHVAGLWITSPPDALDALLFRAPTFFSAWGVIAMWALFGAALLALLLRRLRLRWWVWRLGHTTLALITVSGSVVHALLIQGTMETMSKVAICTLVVLATARVLYDLRVWTTETRRKQKA
jgi:predicted ferric reductase